MACENSISTWIESELCSVRALIEYETIRTSKSTSRFNTMRRNKNYCESYDYFFKKLPALPQQNHMSVRIFGGILIIGVLNFPGVSASLARNAVVFSIPSIVLIFGREDEFPPPVIDIKFIVFNEIGCGEYGFKVVVNAVITCGEGIRDIESHDFPLQVLLNGCINASVGIHSNEHDVIVCDILRGIDMRWIDLRRLGSVAKLPEVVITDSERVVHELNLSGEEIDLRSGSIKGSNGPRHNTDGGVCGI